MRKKKYQLGDVVLPNTEDWQEMNPQIQLIQPFMGSKSVGYNPLPQPTFSGQKRQFDFTQPNAWGLGIMGAFIGSKMLLNSKEDRNYQAYKDRWIRNYNIPSLLQDPNKFSSEMYESPIYQQGGVARPSTGDSLAVYNNAIAVRNYYENKGKYRPQGDWMGASYLKQDKTGYENTTQSNERDYQDFKKRNGFIQTKFGDNTTLKDYDYRMKINDNVYYQREGANSILDLDAPMSRFDKRIEPTQVSAYKNVDTKDDLYGNFVTYYSYDPIAVKPWNMLTPEEKKTRIERYGSKANPNYDVTQSTRPVGNWEHVGYTPPSGKNSIGFDTMRLKEPMKKSNKIATVKTPVTPSKQSVLPSGDPTPQPVRLTDGESVFGPSNALIGTYNNGNFYPDYNNLAERTQVNQADTDLINNQEALQAYINKKYGKGKIQSKQLGGMTRATSADSLKVYNNSVALQKFYDSVGHSKSIDTKKATMKDFLNDGSFKDSEDMLNREREIAFRYPDIFIQDYTRSGYSTEEANRAFQNMSNYSPKNTKYTRNIQDLVPIPSHWMAPSLLYDKRINPQGIVTYRQDDSNRNVKGNLRGNVTVVPYYDPIAVKPWNMLTEKERAMRLKKYGVPADNTEQPEFTPRFKKHEAIAQFPTFTPDGPTANLKSLPGNDPTKYDFTFPVDGYNNQQTIYFRNAEDWKNFIKGQKGVSSREGSDYGTATGYLEKGGIYIKPENRGKFTATKKRTGKSTEELTHSKNPVTRKRAIFAQNAAKWHHQTGGLTMNTPEDQGAGYFKYPDASSLTFPGTGARTFVPGPFPLMVKDSRGTQIMTNKPIRTYGTVREIPIFEEGGEVRTVAPKVDRKDATIEAQKGELIFGAGMPGDVDNQEDRVGAGLYKIEGNPHSKGGTPLNAHPGDFVFSKETSLAATKEESELLVGKEVKKLKDRTPAKLASKYLGLNKYLDMAQDDELDPITRKTAILNVNNYIDRLAEIAYAQEEKKGFPTGVPDFVQASLQTRFDQKGLQNDLNSYKYGGSVNKYQTGGTTDPWDSAPLVNSPSAGFNRVGSRGWNTLYSKPGASSMNVGMAIPGGTPSSQWEQAIINMLQNGISPEELVKKRYIGPEGARKYSSYYTPGSNTQYQRTTDPFDIPRVANFPQITQLKPNIPYKLPEFNLDQTQPGPTPPTDQFTEIPNQNFNVNLAEATNLLAAWAPSESRYPPAFRNYEIQNAKAQIASTGRPISEQPYLNSIQRSQLGFDQNNNPYGAAGATRSLGAYQASLGAQNQAISQVYNQNIARQDQRSSALAQLEIQDGVDRITNAEKYDNKLEMLANNRELEAKDRLRNTSNIFNQMVSDRENKRLFNVMSEWYQINPNGSVGLKPTYKIDNGRLVPVQRNVRDLVLAQQASTQQYNPALQLARSLESMGYRREDIARILSRTWDDYDKPNNKQ